MADDKRTRADANFTRGDAAHTVVSLSQALLAPLDAILKAQVHAARSFLNLVLQIGYPHQPMKVPAAGQTPAGSTAPAASGTPPLPPVENGDARPSPGDGRPYQMEFFHDMPGGSRQKVSIPALALVPIAPLGVSGAEFTFDFHVREIGRHPQIQASERQSVELEQKATQGSSEGEMDRFNRPWFLVDTPVSVQGTFAPGAASDESASSIQSEEARMHIAVKIDTMPVPAALERLLAGLTQIASVEDKPVPEQPSRPS